MGIVASIQSAVSKEIFTLYNVQLEDNAVLVNETKPEFEGDYTVVLFAFVKSLKKSPEVLGNELGSKLVESNPQLFSGYNVIKGFLNLSVSDNYWSDFLFSNYSSPSFGFAKSNGKKIMVEYSSPNTNKPLHLGHLRNNFLGWSIAEIYKANGYDIVKTCIVNDRGVHICKSMLAWQKFGNGASPESTGMKGDHLVGDYYVQFENELKQQSAPIIAAITRGEINGFSPDDTTKLKGFVEKLKDAAVAADKKKELEAEIKEIARNYTPIMQEVREMLLKWEEGDTETLALWSKMNGWVYKGFQETYDRIGSDFTKIYYESETYLLGKKFVEEGLSKGVFTKRADGSVWIDLTADGLDEKLLLRKDGTSVYITQDLGLAKQKYDDYKMDQSIYVIGDEQNYHMKVLKLICQKLQIPKADDIYHLSYGMVELPKDLGSRMKSREGTVVDADDLCDEMAKYAEEETKAKGKTEGFTKEELHELYETLGLGAMKFFLLRVEPKKRIVFDPREGIEIHGFTGPFIQYTHARTKSILRKEQPEGKHIKGELLPQEKAVVIELEKFESIIAQAGVEMNPSVMAGYLFKLAQTYNSFVTALRVLTAESPEKKELRLQLSQLVVNVIKSGMGLLGIKVPERM